MAKHKSEPIIVAAFANRFRIKRQSGSHRTLSREGLPDFVFAFHDGEEIGPHMLMRIAKKQGLSPKISKITVSSAS
jgi:predicted RNA binding protein YcfA (HicA-like mRNA interferase family)